MKKRADETQQVITGNLQRRDGGLVPVEFHIPPELGARLLDLHENRYYEESTLADLMAVVVRAGLRDVEDRRRKTLRYRNKMNLNGLPTRQASPKEQISPATKRAAYVEEQRVRNFALRRGHKIVKNRPGWFTAANAYTLIDRNEKPVLEDSNLSAIEEFLRHVRSARKKTAQVKPGIDGHPQKQTTAPSPAEVAAEVTRVREMAWRLGLTIANSPARLGPKNNGRYLVADRAGNVVFGEHYSANLGEIADYVLRQLDGENRRRVRFAPRASPEGAVQTVEAFVQSGLSRRAFCDREGISVDTLNHWIRHARRIVPELLAGRGTDQAAKEEG